jgi:hypothetical protein
MVRPDSVVDPRAGLTTINLSDAMSGETSAADSANLRTYLLEHDLTASRHHKRSIALTMLLVWVFALLSGVANACLTEPRGELAHAGIQVSQADPPAPAAVQPHAADQAQHGEHPDKAPCQKSCDASSQTLLKQLPKVDTPDLQALVLRLTGRSTTCTWRRPPWSAPLLQRFHRPHPLRGCSSPGSRCRARPRVAATDAPARPLLAARRAAPTC